MTSSHISWRMLFRSAGHQSISVMQRAWPALLTLTFFELITGVSVQWGRSGLFQANTTEGLFVFYGLVESFTVYILSTIWLIVIVSQAKQVHEQPAIDSDMVRAGQVSEGGLFPGGYLKQVVIEDLRRFAGLIFYMTLLIVPGVIRWVRWMFVPLIVIDSRDYEEGRLDALKGSAQLTRGHFFRCLLVLVLSLFIAELVPSLIWPETHAPILQYAGQAAAAALMALPFHLYSISLLYCFFLELKKEKRLHD